MRMKGDGRAYPENRRGGRAAVLGILGIWLYAARGLGFGKIGERKNTENPGKCIDG